MVEFWWVDNVLFIPRSQNLISSLPVQHLEVSRLPPKGWLHLCHLTLLLHTVSITRLKDILVKSLTATIPFNWNNLWGISINGTWFDLDMNWERERTYLIQRKYLFAHSRHEISFARSLETIYASCTFEIVSKPSFLITWLMSTNKMSRMSGIFKKWSEIQNLISCDT